MDYKFSNPQEERIAGQVRQYVSPEQLEDHLASIHERSQETGLSLEEVTRAHINKIIDRHE